VFEVTLPTGKISSDVDEAVLFISKDSTSKDISLIHLAESSITPIILLAPADGVVKFIDLMDIGSG
jgi:hypothetical protein